MVAVQNLKGEIIQLILSQKGGGGHELIISEMFFPFQNQSTLSSVKCTVHYHYHIIYYRVIPL
jgi:hypothetical protein